MKKFFVIASVLIFCLLGYEFVRRKVGSFGGSYPFAESWNIKKSMDEIEINLLKLHQRSPQLFLNNEALEIKEDATGYWKTVDFFYPDRKEIVHVLFREKGDQTTISLVRFINNDSGEVKVMNKDFNWFKNRREKKIFETRILNNL